MDLSKVAEARQSWETPVSWCVILLKAYSIVAARRPSLRQAYLSLPFPRLYEHPANVASVCIEREFEGEKALFYARIYKPELVSLAELNSIVRTHKTNPIESIPSFGESLKLSRLPRPLRRLIWKTGLDCDGSIRAKYFGTFAVSVVASLGAASLFIYTPMTTTLHYGVFDSNWNLDVRLSYDHRVMDGGEVARAIAELEEVLQNEILSELRQGSVHRSDFVPLPFKQTDNLVGISQGLVAG